MMDGGCVHTCIWWEWEWEFWVGKALSFCGKAFQRTGREKKHELWRCSLADDGLFVLLARLI